MGTLCWIIVVVNNEVDPKGVIGRPNIDTSLRALSIIYLAWDKGYNYVGATKLSNACRYIWHQPSKGHIVEWDPTLQWACVTFTWHCNILMKPQYKFLLPFLHTLTVFWITISTTSTFCKQSSTNICEILYIKDNLVFHEWCLKLKSFLLQSLKTKHILTRLIFYFFLSND